MSGAALKIDNSGEMDVEQAAAYCKIKPKTLYNKISAGQGPRHIKKFGNLVFFSSDLDQWIKANTKVIKAFS